MEGALSFGGGGRMMGCVGEWGTDVDKAGCAGATGNIFSGMSGS